MFRLLGLTASLLAGVTGCQQPIAGPAGTHLETSRATAAPPQLDPQYILTTGGDYVLSNPPPGVEISFGSKQVRRVGWDDFQQLAAAAGQSISTHERILGN